MVVVAAVVVWKVPLLPSPAPSPWLPLAVESIITASPLPVLPRGDSPTPPLVVPFLCHRLPPSEVSSRPRQSSPPPLCTRSRAPVPVATAELIATFVPTEVQPAVLAPHPDLGQRGRGAGRPRVLGKGPL